MTEKNSSENSPLNHQTWGRPPTIGLHQQGRRRVGIATALM